MMMVCGKGQKMYGRHEERYQGVRMYGWIDKDGPTGTDRKGSMDDG